MLSRRKRQRGALAGAQDGPEQDGTACVRHRGRSLVFHLDNPRDTVQKVLARGQFYEADLLSSHRDLVFRGSTVVDVGANVGNHTVFYAVSGARRVYPMEPNPRARTLLERTVAANDLPGVDLAHVELAAGSEKTELRLRTPNPDNLGKTIVGAEGSDTVQVRPLDTLHFDGRVSLIKVDVEGMEMEVLAGARETISEHRPALGVEVDDSNAATFWDWVEEHRYHVVRKVKTYPANANYVCIPKGAVPHRGERH